MAKKTSSRKRSNARKWAPVGLILSAASILAGIILLAMKLLEIMQISTQVKWINTALLISLGTFILGFALYAFLDPKRVREFITGRQAKHGSNALIMLVAMIGILFVVNLIAYQNKTPWDWTENKQHTLAPETLNTLEALPSPVKALGFFTQNYSSTSAEDILSDFKDSSAGMFDYEIVDPESNPALAQQYNVTRNGTVILVLEGRQEMLSYVSEQQITGALIRLMNPGERVVYFLIGHGEGDIRNSGDTSFVNAVKALEAKNYQVLTLNLRAENEIPENALAIIIAGPTKPIAESEANLLKTYTENGGALVVLEQCTLEQDAGITADAFLDYLSQDWKVTYNDDIVIDSSSDQLLFAISYTYGEHAITTNLQNTITFFPITRSMLVNPTDANITQYPLIYTTDRAYGETDFQALANNYYAYDSGVDTPGPILVAAALENSTTGGKLVVFGDSSFATDLFYDQYGNADLFMNAVDWAAGEQDMISLTVRDTIERTLNPIKNVGWITLGLSFICIIPGIIVLGGVVSWISRRAKG